MAMRPLHLFLMLLPYSGLFAQQYASYSFERLDGPVASVLKQAHVALLAMDDHAVLSGEGHDLKVRVRNTFSLGDVQTVLQQSTGGVYRALHSSALVRSAQENSIRPVLPDGAGKVSSDDIMALLATMAQAHGGPAYLDTGDEDEDSARFISAFEEWSVSDPEGSAALVTMVRSLLQTH